MSVHAPCFALAALLVVGEEGEDHPEPFMDRPCSSGLTQGPWFLSHAGNRKWNGHQGSSMPRLEVPFYTIKHVSLGKALFVSSVEGEMSRVCDNFKSAEPLKQPSLEICARSY